MKAPLPFRTRLWTGGEVAGMPLAELVAAWEKPFLTEDQGGCPAQEERPSWYAPARLVEEGHGDRGLPH